MTNREIVDYVLSNKLKPTEAIKEYCYFKDNLEHINYIFYDGSGFHTKNYIVPLIHFCDSVGLYKRTYEIISKQVAYEEQDRKDRKTRIKELEKELNILMRKDREDII